MGNDLREVSIQPDQRVDGCGLSAASTGTGSVPEYAGDKGPSRAIKLGLLPPKSAYPVSGENRIPWHVMSLIIRPAGIVAAGNFGVEGYYGQCYRRFPFQILVRRWGVGADILRLSTCGSLVVCQSLKVIEDNCVTNQRRNACSFFDFRRVRLKRRAQKLDPDPQ